MTARTTTRSVSRRKSMSASATCLRMMSRASIVGVVTEILLVCWVMLSHEDDAVANRYPVDPLLTPRPGTLLTRIGRRESGHPTPVVLAGVATLMLLHRLASLASMIAPL